MSTNHLHIDESLLLTQLRDGNSKAFEAIYHRYANNLLYKLMKMVKDQDLAEELLQDLFVKVWERRNQIDPAKAFKAFLFQIARNMVVDHYRKSARRLIMETHLQHTTTELHSNIDDKIATAETKDLLDQVLEQLPPQRRQAFQLCKIDGLTYDQAAEVMKISPHTVRNHLAQASTTVKDFLSAANPAFGTMLAISILF